MEGLVKSNQVSALWFLKFDPKITSINCGKQAHLRLSGQGWSEKHQGSRMWCICLHFLWKVVASLWKHALPSDIHFLLPSVRRHCFPNLLLFEQLRRHHLNDKGREEGGQWRLGVAGWIGWEKGSLHYWRNSHLLRAILATDIGERASNEHTVQHSWTWTSWVEN